MERDTDPRRPLRPALPACPLDTPDFVRHWLGLWSVGLLAAFLLGPAGPLENVLPWIFPLGLAAFAGAGVVAWSRLHRATR